jgi:ABC-type antimicrobial peptide transport system permease subunit
MLKNYFLVALRNFRRNKLFSIINIVGLAIGISASLIITLLVWYDFTFDKFEKDSDRIYRVTSSFTFNGNTNSWGCITQPMGDAMTKELTGFELIAPFRSADNMKVTLPYPAADKPQVLKREKDMVYADGRYFDLIHYDWIAGSPTTSLRQPYQVVITAENAHRYYPGLAYPDIIGKAIFFEDTVQASITGIVKDIPYNTDFSFKTFISYSTLETTRLKPNGWGQWGSTSSADQLFVRMMPGASVSRLIAGMNGLIARNEKRDANDKSSVYVGLQPFADMHFDTKYGIFNNSHQAHKSTLYGLLAVAAFLLLLACINFINLTTAQASQRAREIGIRKTMGGYRRQLALQFLNETFLLTVMATILSLAITPLLLKVFSDFIPAGFHFNLFRHPEIFGFLAALIVIVSLLSGIYPALVLSSYNPVLVLKNQAYANTGKTRSAWLRKTLTVSQFVIAQVFIIATLLVSRQINFELHKDLGFHKDAILYFHTNRRDSAQQRNLLLDELHAIPGIAMISIASDPPSTNGMWSSRITYVDGKKEIQEGVQIKLGDSNYFPMFKFHMLAGEPMPHSDTTNAVVINDTYAKKLGFVDPGKAVGKRLKWQGNPYISGVIADFHPSSLHQPINSLLIANGTKNQHCFNIELLPENSSGSAWPRTIAAIGMAFQSVYPNDDFEYHFIDDTVAKFYDAEKNLGRLLLWSTGLTIFISCLGLFGLVIYITNQRTKEIGIRKVIGASVMQIIVLLSRDFMKLIALAILIALPIAWWGSNKWLENFAFRTNISWWIFAIGGGILLGIALLILCLRTFRVAVINPVESLRSE